MADYTFDPGVYVINWRGPATVLGTAAWFTNLNYIAKASATRAGLVVNKAGSNQQFAPFKQLDSSSTLLIDGYLMSVKTRFKLDDSNFTIAAAPVGTKLAAPDSPQASPLSQTALSITGSSVASAAGYQLYTAATETGTYAKLGGVLTTPTYSHTGLSAAQTQWYQWQTLGDGATYLDSDRGAPFKGTTLVAGSVATFNLTQVGAPGIGHTLFEEQKQGFVSRSSHSTHNTKDNNHNFVKVKVNARGMSDFGPSVAVYIDDAFYQMIPLKGAAETLTDILEPVTGGIALPDGLKGKVMVRAGAARFFNLITGYQDPSLMEVEYSGGTQATAYTPTAAPDGIAVWGDSIESSFDGNGVDGTYGFIPQARVKFGPGADIYSLSASGAEIVLDGASAADQLRIATQVVTGLSRHAGRRTFYVMRSTNDFGAGTMPKAMFKVLSSIVDKIRVLDPTIMTIGMEALARAIENEDKGAGTLTPYRQVMSDVGVGREAYYKYWDTTGLITVSDTADGTHPIGAGIGKLVNGFYSIYTSTAAATGTAVVSQPAPSSVALAAYEGDNALDSTANHLDLAASGSGAAVGFANGAMVFGSGQTLTRPGTPLDYLFEGFDVNFSLQYTGNNDIFHTPIRVENVYEIGTIMSSSTQGNIRAVVYDISGADNRAVVINGPSMNLAAGQTVGKLKYREGLVTLTVGTQDYTTPLSSVFAKQRKFELGRTFAGNIDYVRLNTGGGASAPVTPPPAAGAPTVSKASPATGRPGSQYTVQGTNLKGATVTFSGGVVATNVLENASDVQIVVSVPNGVVTGNVTVSNANGTVSAGTFTLADATSPVIYSFSPYAGIPGDRVTITGINLLGSTVTLAGQTMPTEQNSYDSQILVLVPAGAKDGELIVTNQAGKTISAGYFAVGIPAQAPQVLPDPDFLNPIGTDWVESVPGGWIVQNGQAVRQPGVAGSVLSSQTKAGVDVTGKRIRFRIAVTQLDAGAALAYGASATSIGYEQGSHNVADVFYFTLQGTPTGPRQLIELGLNNANVAIDKVEAFVLN